MKTLNFFFAIIFLLLSTPGYTTDKLRILNWWDYLPDQVRKNLQKSGNRFNILEYRSNEVALSKLFNKKENYDVAIVSNWVAQILHDSNLIDNQLLKNLITDRKYKDFLIQRNVNCVPLLWAVTTFTYNTKETHQIQSLSELIQLKKKGKSIGIIDDSKEFYYALKNDPLLDKCTSSKEKCTTINNLKAKDFISSFADSIPFISAGYGWHGEISLKIENHTHFNFSVPKNKPVIGTDYVCALKRQNKMNKEDILKFITEITSMNNIKYFTKSTQYFSPYMKQNKKLLGKKTYKLFTQSIRKIEQGNYTQIKKQDLKEIKETNSLWRMVRYNSK